MAWEKELNSYLRTNRRIRLVFVTSGVLLMAFGLLRVYFNLEELYLTNFGRPLVGITAPEFLYLVLPYLFWGLALMVAGIILEKKLSVESAALYSVILALLPVAYALAKLLLVSELGINPHVSYLKYAFLSAVLLGAYLSTSVLPKA